MDIQAQYLERFLRYVEVNTRSDASFDTVPTTDGQLTLARLIQQELEQIGLSDIELDDNGYLFATLPSNLDYAVPTVGFIAHMDTAPGASGENVQPKIIHHYNGKTIKLNESVELSPADFPILEKYLGKTLITTDGTTLLGADNKAGIAAIITAMEYLLANPEIPHGHLRIGFTPDEEIGRSAKHFDVDKFDAHWAYTIDGGEEGELECESFNASDVTVTFKGRNVHPGTAKGMMVNASHLAREFANQLPPYEVPEHTEGREGFFHLQKMSGCEAEATLHYLVRDHDRDKFENRKALMLKIAELMNFKYGEKRVHVEMSARYFNMFEEIEKVPHVMEVARDAFKAAGVEAIEKPIRGGTDGARLSFMGLPCPNIFTGGHNFHGVHEFLVLESALKAVDVIVEVAKITASPQ